MTSFKNKYETIVINLKSVAMTKPHEKHVIVEDGNFIVTDERYFPFFMRWYTGDGRNPVILFLKKLTQDVAVLLKDQECSSEMRQKVIQLLPAFKTGLDCIKITYSLDRVIHLTVESLVDQVDDLIREHRV